MHLARGVVPFSQTGHVLDAEDIPAHLQGCVGDIRKNTYTFYVSALQGPVQYVRLIRHPTTSMFSEGYLDFGDGRPRLHVYFSWDPKHLLDVCTVQEATQLLPCLFAAGGIRCLDWDGLTGVPAFDTLQRLFRLLHNQDCTVGQFYSEAAAVARGNVCTLHARSILRVAPWQRPAATMTVVVLPRSRASRSLS
jgi:hypothetical protein